MNKMLLSLVLVVIVLAGAYALIHSNNSDIKQAVTSEGTSTNSGTIAINGLSYSPSTLTVKVGTTITWKNNDSAAHTVTTDGGPVGFDSGQMDAGGSFTFTFTDAGTYTYHCTFHSGMTGSIVVTE